MNIVSGKDAVRTVAENRWVVLALLTIGWIIAFIDRTNMSAALADKTFIHEYALNSVERGWLGSAVYWSYAVVQIPMGWLVDRYGVKWPYAVCFTLWCLVAAATGLQGTLFGLVVIRLMIGIAESVVMPASYRYLANHFDEAHKGFANGLLALGGKVGPALGAALAAWLITVDSWRAMFVITGAAGLLWLVPWLLMVRNDFPSKQQLDTHHRGASTVPLRNLLVSPVVWGGLLMTFCSSYFVFYAATWMPAYLVEQRHLSLLHSGLYTFASFISVAVIAVLAGWGADRLIARGFDALKVRKSFSVIGLLGGTTILLGAYATSQEAALFWNVTSLASEGLATANIMTLSKLTLIPKPAVGLNTGVMTVATSLAGGVSASLSGWLLQVGGSFTWPMMAVCVTLVIGALACVVLMRREWAPKVAVSA